MAALLTFEQLAAIPGFRLWNPENSGNESSNSEYGRIPAKAASGPGGDRAIRGSAIAPAPALRAGSALRAPLLSLAREEGIFSVTLDSRNVEPGALFVALKGASDDGHRYVEAALRAGAGAAMVAEDRLADPALGLADIARRAGASLIVVEDTLRGLQDAAAAYLAGFPRLLKVSITGSAGKSTTKEICAAMMRAERETVCNEGNLNSETGLPLAVFGVRPRHEVCVFEMGMNRRGEIAELARVLKPHIALITNIGPAHIGMIGSIAGIVEEKKQIFSQFTGTETALIPEDEPYREELAEGVLGKVSYYGPCNLEAWGGVRDRGLAGTEITWGGKPVLFAIPGRHNVKNALAAAAIARAAGLSDEALRQGLASVRALGGRSEILRRASPGGGEMTVVRDCYNSNPAGAAEALAFCEGLDWPGRRVYVLGSMLELGAFSAEAHEKLGEALAASRAERVFFYGPETEAALGAFRRAGGGERASLAPSLEALAGALGGCLRGGDLLLLKGSRGCALERVLDLLPAPAREAGERRP
ncbi:MAG: UDP-N-acetylmuramoyl-tripeptide--D-alanyl-D-alanine ligase [Spirochaetaceae bacterium]|jgi:UDP-N-acetylmuramoyl-tripeptide--D-alanyl-D-alanine ligase|nr:UDP-N-acetylmuramoyl-tripeptide--D-alanyl-D-alanine ligase [Spirochaetaceae bacterium]